MITIGPFIIPSTHPDTPDGASAIPDSAWNLSATAYCSNSPSIKMHPTWTGSSSLLMNSIFRNPKMDGRSNSCTNGFTTNPPATGALSPSRPYWWKSSTSCDREWRWRISSVISGQPFQYRKTAAPIGGNLQHGEINLTEALANLGFVVSSVYFHGVTLKVDVAWSFQDDHSGWKNITAGFIEFRPRCGKLNDGKWIGQRWNECIESHYFARFAAVAPKKPIDSLRSAEDIENLLKHYEWTNTTRHSEAEIRQMRIEAIQKNPELWATPKKLAEHLKNEELYSRNTSTSQVVKFLPALLREAGSEKANKGE